ncbi:MAG TPA: hypothetical protein VIW68_12665 [Candidatus Sulfotelmatobacter sp.]
MKHPPAAAEAAVNRLSPRNLYGKPKMRLIWGADRLQFIQGFFTDWTSSGLLLRHEFAQRWVPKYPKVDRWYLEVWEPPEFFGSPDTWNQQLRTYEGSRSFVELGPYPSQGDYRPLAILEHQETGEMVEPTEVLIEHIFSRMSVPTSGDLHKAENARQEAADIDIHKTVDNMFGDPFPFGGRINNVTPMPLVQKLAEKKKQKGASFENYDE